MVWNGKEEALVCELQKLGKMLYCAMPGPVQDTVQKGGGVNVGPKAEVLSPKSLC